MKILHTSDWHLGRSLHGAKRYDEFAAFLDWLVHSIEHNDIDVLLVAGDVFDNSAPSNRAQALYYRFLSRVAGSNCRHVVIVAGNHDSPTFLSAPSALLKALDVHVIGQASADPGDQVLVLEDGANFAQLIVCAVPYLRDRDIRVAEAGESIEDKDRKLIDGIRNHYAAVAALAEQRRKQLGGAIPIVAMGHLFAAGGQTIDGDGVRELYVGSLAHVSAAIFAPVFDYVALGHLHVAQKVNDSQTIRYSGSPLAMGFGEAHQQKSVCLVEFSGAATSVSLLEVPVFQQLERIAGDWPAIEHRLVELLATDSTAWLEIIYQGDDVMGDLRQRVESALADTALRVLRIRNNRVVERVLGRMHDDETLDDLGINDVFERCLAAHDISVEQRPELVACYQEIIDALNDNEALTLQGEPT